MPYHVIVSTAPPSSPLLSPPPPNIYVKIETNHVLWGDILYITWSWSLVFPPKRRCEVIVGSQLRRLFLKASCAYTSLPPSLPISFKTFFLSFYILAFSLFLFGSFLFLFFSPFFVVVSSCSRILCHLALPFHVFSIFFFFFSRWQPFLWTSSAESCAVM